jgi:hypothetical protein
MLFPLIGDAIGRAWMRRVVVGSAGLVVAAMAVIACQIQFDWLGGALSVVMRRDPTGEGLDWVSLRDDLRGQGLLAPGTVAAALNWRDAGKIGYALGPDVTMLCLCSDSRQFGFAHRLRNYGGRDVLVLEVNPPAPVSGWFARLETMMPASVRLKGRVLRTVSVLQGFDLHPTP